MVALVVTETKVVGQRYSKGTIAVHAQGGRTKVCTPHISSHPHAWFHNPSDSHVGFEPIFLATGETEPCLQGRYGCPPRHKSSLALLF